MIKIYDLRDDRYTINLIQDATLHTEDAGLKVKHGLFGSTEWWGAIEKGVIPKNRIKGVISRVYMSGHNDFPEFEVTSESGRSSWERNGDDYHFVVGRKIEIVYVTQDFKKPIEIRRIKGRRELMTASRIILEILVQEK